MTICTRRLIAAAVLGSAVLVGGSAEALFGPADKNYTPSGDWDVGYQQSIGNNGICYAHSVYNNGNVQIWIGSRLNEEDNKQSWFLALYNKQWTWVKAGKTYHINLLPPDRKKVFWIDFEVVTHDDGLPFLVAGITKELANALALEKKKGAVGIFLGNGKFLNALELTNSAGAIRGRSLPQKYSCNNDSPRAAVKRP